MSALIRVPKKLERGMTVVFRKLNEPWRTWQKAVLDYYDKENECYIVVGKLDDEVLGKDEYLVIRSVALDDDQAQLNRRARMRAKYRDRTSEEIARKSRLSQLGD